MRRLLVLLMCLFLLPILTAAQDYNQLNYLLSTQQNPTQIPHQRERLTLANLQTASTLGVWGTGPISAAAWLDDNHVGIASMRGSWIYDLQQPNQPLMLTPLQFTHMWPTRSPNGMIGHIWRYYDDYSLQPNVLGVWRFDGLENRLLLHRANGLPMDDESLPVSGAEIIALDSHDGYLASAQGNIAYVWSDPGNEEPIAFIHPPSNRTDYFIEAGSLSADARWLVTAARAVISDQLIISLWDVQTRERYILYESEYLPLMRTIPWLFDWDQGQDELLVYGQVVFSTIADQPHDIFWRWNVATLERTDLPLPCAILDSDQPYVRFMLVDMDTDHNRAICTSYFPNGTRITAVVDWLTETVLAQFEGRHGNEYRISLSPNGRYIAIPVTFTSDLNNPSGFRFGVYIHDLEKNVPVEPIPMHDGYVIAAHFDHRGRLLTAGSEGTVRVWEVGSDQPLVEVTNSTVLTITQLAFSPDGKWLFSAAPGNPRANWVYAPGSVRRWDVQQGTSEIFISDDQLRISGIVFDPAGDWLYMGDLNQKLHRWNANTYEPVDTFDNAAAIDRLLISASGRLLVAVSQNGLSFWDTATMTIINRIEQPWIGERCLVQFFPGDTWLRVCDQLYRVEDNGRLIAQWEPANLPEELQSWGEQSNLILLPELMADPSSIATMPMIQYLNVHTAAINPAQDLMAYGANDGVITLSGIPRQGAGS
ncbi:MAG: hypothetical protein J0M33_00840 [Anaerolineae bacterium]|nr:hypothetical protein [Anaerolineae bacterium]